MAEDRARELMKELEEDLRRHEASARKLLSEVPTDADEINVRQHVRLRSKASAYGHAAELVADASTRLPDPLDVLTLFGNTIHNLSKIFEGDHDFQRVTFSMVGSTILAWVHSSSRGPIEVQVSSIRKLGTTRAFDEAIAAWRSRPS